MRIPWSERFRVEAEERGLRWNCESCVHFTGEERCAHDFPTQNHRAARYADGGVDVLFCKEHELA
ncbi:MAG: hypothetical protein AAGH15_24955 [Myxococcota bacterium]